MPTVLIVDNNHEDTARLKRVVRKHGYDVLTSENGETALSLIEKNPVDVVLLDVGMPRMNGYEVCQKIRRKYSPSQISVIFMTAVLPTNSSMKKGLACKGDDYLIKPVRHHEVVTRIGRLLNLRQSQQERDLYHESLVQAHADLKARFLETISALVTALEEKDRYTKGHSQRVSEYAVRMARVIRIPQQKVDLIRTAGLLHDIGKIGISQDILNKPGPLDEGEYAIIRTHTLKGQHIVSPLKEYRSIGQLILLHHERMDGKGYHRVPGKHLPLLARILSVADAYDAMTTTRAYRKAMSHSDAMAELNAHSGTQFDPDCIGALQETLGLRQQPLAFA